MAQDNKTAEQIALEKAAEAKRIEAEEKAVAEAAKKAEKEAAKVAKEEKTVTLTQEQLDLLINRIQTLEKGQKTLEDTSSPDQIKRIEAIRAKGGLVKSVKIAEIDGRLVKSWASTADEVYIDHALGKEVSSQMTKLSFFDGGEKDISQANFARVKIMKAFEVIKEGKDKVGNIVLTVTTDDGKEFDIDSRYIN
jgi:uncharacterized coiled-coil protein SlyX